MRKFLTFALITAATMNLHAADSPTVKTDKGKVAGTVSADGQVRMFKGIPYAAPPVGPLRWKAPRPAPKWHDTHEAMNFGPHCMQPRVYDDMVFPDPGQSEDCLTLNVWTPAKDDKAKLPVMVWIHGGGFAGGSASEPRQNGEVLAHKGVIIVSMNYRLNIFGFLVHPELAAESPEHASGNYGLLDQVAALQWVHKNIKKFGGDPDKVTIFGESAGSQSVSGLMASPLAQGLFARVIGESGSAFHGPRLPETREEREKLDPEKIAGVLHTAKLSDLRAMSAEEILKVVTPQGNGTPTPHFGPVVDGYFMPEDAAAIYGAGKQARVPLLAGWNADEGSFGQQTLTIAEYKNMAAKWFGPQAEKFLAVYAANTDEEALRAAKDFTADDFIAYSTWRWLDAHAATGNQPVYRYHFELTSPGDKFHPAGTVFHSDDIEYVFGTLDSRQQAVWRPEDRQMSELMQTYWTNFAKTGDPNGPGLPQWPLYNAKDGWTVMHLDAKSEAKPDAHRDRYEFLRQEWEK